MVAEDAVVVGRLVEVLDDLQVERFEVELALVVEVGFDVPQHLGHDVPVQDQVLVLLLGKIAVNILEDLGAPVDVILADALSVLEGQLHQVRGLPLVTSNQSIGQHFGC